MRSPAAPPWSGGTVSTVYTVKILSSGTTTAGSIILDFSGSSFHYDSGGSISVRDDAHDPSGLPASFDYEGVPKQRVDLIADGVGAGVVHDTRTAARTLSVTEYTVQDHLKAIFNKTKTHDRRTLLNAALGP